MVKKGRLFLILLSLLSLTGCFFPNRRTQYFIGGHFVAYENNNVFLKVENITKEVFDDSNGVNVLKSDNNNPPYFKITLYEKLEDNSYLYYEFYNLKGSTASSEPYSFTSEIGHSPFITICPLFNTNEEEHNQRQQNAIAKYGSYVYYFTQLHIYDEDYKNSKIFEYFFIDVL